MNESKRPFTWERISPFTWSKLAEESTTGGIAGLGGGTDETEQSGDGTESATSGTLTGRAAAAFVENVPFLNFIGEIQSSLFNNNLFFKRLHLFDSFFFLCIFIY